MMSRQMRKLARQLESKLRRVAIESFSALIWVLEGYEDEDGNKERFVAEHFPGSGFISIPPEKARSEAIVAALGTKGNHHAVIATRDADTLAKVEDQDGTFGYGEAAVFNDTAVLRLGDKIAARKLGADTEPVAKLSDALAIVNAIKTAAVATGAPDSGATFKANLITALEGFPVGSATLEVD